MAWHKVDGSTLWTFFSGRLGEAGSQESAGAACQVRWWVTVELPGGLYRRVSAFLRVELTHSPADSNLYRSHCEGNIHTCRAALGFDGLGASTIVLQEERNFFKV